MIRKAISISADVIGDVRQPKKASIVGTPTYSCQTVCGCQPTAINTCGNTCNCTYAGGC